MARTRTTWTIARLGVFLALLLGWTILGRAFGWLMHDVPALSPVGRGAGERANIG
jgi:hypothetical protein